MQSPSQILQQYWGYACFRGEQEKIIQSVFNKKDTLALLPTGGGKSICFQVPALMQNGLCLVISPLIALMKDQVENLLKKNIPALCINSGMNFFEVSQTLKNAASGDFKFLYVSPERLKTELFLAYLHELDISMIAVDEAHCISQWGYDFRPAYLSISLLRDELPNVPIIALTASATPLVQKDIIIQLHFRQHNIFQQSFHRENLSYSVFKVDSKINKLINVLNNVQGTAIVYCRTRRQTKNVAGLLMLQNIQADFYHAGLTQEERSAKQQSWMNNTTRVMVCTNAFGMGIDKPDVRAVVHYDVPDCLENYYQEAGRAGRDGQKAFAVLLYHEEDENNLKQLPQQNFPAIGIIRKIYQALADYLQIPVGIGEGNYYDFDLIDFAKKFQLETRHTIAALKVLEQEGFINFSENIFLQSHVQFTADKSILNDIENTYPHLDAVAKCLLRTYAGIYDNLISINEKQIARLCKLPYGKVYSDLQQLHLLNIIEYLPQKETPQIYFPVNRTSAATIEIDAENYAKREKEYKARIETMLNYLQGTICRSIYIGNYFGDETLNDCGVCDNCLEKKKTSPSNEEVMQAAQHILQLTAENKISIHRLLQQTSSFNQQIIWKAIAFLQAEGKITVNDDFLVSVQ
jgi:ATP-dependent DNA helicase, RecQ family